MQGTAADIIKMAMISVHDWLAETNTGTKMIMQVHDELVFEVANDQLGFVRDSVVERMTGAAELNVPLLVETGVGVDWDEAH